MENYQDVPDQNNPQNLFNFGIEPLGLEYLKSSAKWEKFMAIVNFVFIGIGIIAIILGGSTFINLMLRDTRSLNSSLDEFGMASGMMTGLLFFYCLLFVVFLIPNIYRLKFANNCLNGIKNSDTESITKAFKYLKVYSTFWGIITIIGLAFYAFAIIMGLIGLAIAM